MRLIHWHFDKYFPFKAASKSLSNRYPKKICINFCYPLQIKVNKNNNNTTNSTKKGKSWTFWAEINIDKTNFLVIQSIFFLLAFLFTRTTMKNKLGNKICRLEVYLFPCRSKCRSILSYPMMNWKWIKTGVKLWQQMKIWICIYHQNLSFKSCFTAQFMVEIYFLFYSFLSDTLYKFCCILHMLLDISFCS